MLNYENRLVVMTYCIEFESLIQLDTESPTINKEISVGLAALVFTVLTHNEIFSLFANTVKTSAANATEIFLLMVGDSASSWMRLSNSIQ